MFGKGTLRDNPIAVLDKKQEQFILTFRKIKRLSFDRSRPPKEVDDDTSALYSIADIETFFLSNANMRILSSGR